MNYKTIDASHRSCRSQLPGFTHPTADLRRDEFRFPLCQDLWLWFPHLSTCRWRCPPPRPRREYRSRDHRQKLSKSLAAVPSCGSSTDPNPGAAFALLVKDKDRHFSEDHQDVDHHDDLESEQFVYIDDFVSNCIIWKLAK